MAHNGKKITRGLFWSFSERILAQLISFIVSIVLARILLPEQYGIIAIVLVFINIANVFVTNGLGDALIQKKNATEEDFNTIFWCSLTLSIILYFVMFFGATFIASFYRNNDLLLVIRIISIKLPLSSFNTIQRACVSKKMEFRKFFFSTFGGTCISGIIGILLAINGFGVWALVLQYLINSAIDTLILFITVRWKPKLQFSFTAAKELFGFGSKMIVSSLINTIYSEAQSLVIGKVYSASDLAMYKRGNQFPSLFITNVCSSVATVLFPAMVNNSNSVTDVKEMTRESLRITAYIISPLMVGLIAIAKPLVIVLLTSKWAGCIIYLQILCIAYMFQPIQTANCQAYKAIGRSDVYLITEIIKKIVGIGLLLVTLTRGVIAITIAFTISVVISSIITMIPNVSILGYSIKEQILDILPSFLYSAVMFCLIFPISFLSINYLVMMIIQIIIGILAYIGVSFLAKNQSFELIVSYVRGRF